MMKKANLTQHEQYVTIDLVILIRNIYWKDYSPNLLDDEECMQHACTWWWAMMMIWWWPFFCIIWSFCTISSFLLPSYFIAIICYYLYMDPRAFYYELFYITREQESSSQIIIIIIIICFCPMHTPPICTGGSCVHIKRIFTKHLLWDGQANR